MVTIEDLKKTNLFKKIDEIIKYGKTVGITDIYIVPPYIVNKNALYILIRTEAGYNLESLLGIRNMFKEIFGDKLLFSIVEEAGIKELLKEGDNSEYAPMLTQMIPLKALNQNESLDVQWTRAANAAQPSSFTPLQNMSLRAAAAQSAPQPITSPKPNKKTSNSE